jgi:hypothetical protein
VPYVRSVIQVILTPPSRNKLTTKTKQSKFIENDHVVLSRETSDDFLKQILIEICHPQPEYFPEKSTQADHPNSLKFKVAQAVKYFFDRATPVFLPPV